MRTVQEEPAQPQPGQQTQVSVQADTSGARAELYRLLARLTIPLALEKQTITPEQAAALRALLGE